MSYALGVDIGTTFSAAAVYRQGRAEMVSLGYHSPLVPSAVLITSTNETLVGDAALRRGQSEPERLARFFKRRIGDSVPMILGGSPLSSETLTARLLRAVVDRVVEQQGDRPSQVAVTRPANWGPFKQDRFDQAVRLADLQDVTVLTEPEAAALAYAAEQRIAPDAAVAVYDLGGGTFDATVLRRTGNRFSVLGEPEGIERLGGIDFDAAVFEHVRQSLYGAIEALDEDDPVTLRSITRLRNECIEAKEALSSDTQATIPVVLPGMNTEVRLTRSELEAMIRPSLDDSIAALRRAVASAGVEPAELDRVLLVGGSSRIPLVAQVVGSAFGRPVALDAHPKHAVALGAALVAGDEGVDGRAIGATHAVPTASAAGRTGAGVAGAGAAAAVAGAAASGDRWAPPAGPDAPTRVESGGAWSPAASAASPALDDTQVQSGDTCQAPATPGMPSGDAWAPAGSPSGDAWAPAGSPGGDVRSGRGRGGAGVAGGAGAVAAGAAAAGAAAGAGPAHAETASAGAPAGSAWGEAEPGSGSYPPAGGPSAHHGGGGTPGRRWLVPALAAVVAIALGVGAALTLSPGDDDPGKKPEATADDAHAPPAMPTALTESGRQPLPSGGDGVTMDGSGRLWAATLVANTVVRMETPWEADFGSVEIPMDDFGSNTEPLAILYAFDHIWVTLRKSALVVKLDPDAASPDDPAVVGRFDTPGQPAALREYAGYLWVIAGKPDGGANGYLHRIDPATDKVQSVEIDRPNGVVVDDDDRVWVTHGDNLLQEYDLELNPVNDPIPVGQMPDEVVFTEGYVWTADRRSGTVSRVDRDSREVQPVTVGGNPAGLRADGNRLWVVDNDTPAGTGDTSNGRLVLVDTDAMAVVKDVGVGVRPLGLHVDGDTVWVALFDEQAPAVVRVDAS